MHDDEPVSDERQHAEVMRDEDHGDFPALLDAWVRAKVKSSCLRVGSVEDMISVMAASIWALSGRENWVA